MGGPGLVLTVAATRTKPLLRGVFHEWAFYVAIPLGIALGLFAQSTREQVAAATFAAAVTAMFGASALYHRFTWSPATRMWLRRLDHAGIFGLIAGSYTPVGLIVLDGTWRIVVLSVVWGGALLAIIAKLTWVSAPKWLSAGLGVALGWVAIVVFPQILDRVGYAGMSLIVAGGILYTLGALVYAFGRPDPLPSIFGYHELFHVLVVVAVGLQYAAIAFFVLPAA